MPRNARFLTKRSFVFVTAVSSVVSGISAYREMRRWDSQRLKTRTTLLPKLSSGTTFGERMP